MTGAVFIERPADRQRAFILITAMILKAMPLIWSCIKTKPKNEI